MLKFLSSMKFGIVLMVLMIITSILSTVIPTESTETGIFFKVILALPKFFMIVLLFSLIFCTIKKLPIIFATITKDINEEELEKKNSIANTFNTKDVASYEKFIDKYLSTNNYQYKKFNNDKVVFVARKRKFSLLAPHLLHLGIAIVITGALIGSYFGAEGRITLKVGETAIVPREVADKMLVKVNSFKTVYDKRGNVDNWQSDITVNLAGKDQASGTTEVNSPFKYKGVVFYQTAYEYLHKISIKVKGQLVERTIGNRTFDRMTCVLLGEIYFIEKSEDGVNLTIFEDSENHRTYTVKEGETIDFPKGTLTYLNTEANTVLTVKKDPGTVLVMVGFLIMSITSVLFLMGRYREVIISIDPTLNLVNLKVFCKSKSLKDEIIAALTLKS